MPFRKLTAASFTAVVAAAAALGLGIASFAFADPDPKRPSVGTGTPRPQFTIFVWESKAEMDLRNDTTPGGGGRYWGEYSEYTQTLRDAKAMVGGNAITMPDTARRVRVRDGVMTAERPSLSDDEPRLGGYFIIEADDLDAAVALAAKCPAAKTGQVEVRANLVMNPDASSPKP